MLLELRAGWRQGCELLMGAHKEQWERCCRLWALFPLPQGGTEALSRCGVVHILVLGLMQTGGLVLSFHRRLPMEGGQALLQLHGSKASISGGERKLFSSCLAPCFCLPCFDPAHMKKQGSSVQNRARGSAE